jgi:hypothetical protein
MWHSRKPAHSPTRSLAAGMAQPFPVLHKPTGSITSSWQLCAFLLRRLFRGHQKVPVRRRIGRYRSLGLLISNGSPVCQWRCCGGLLPPGYRGVLERLVNVSEPRKEGDCCHRLNGAGRRGPSSRRDQSRSESVSRAGSERRSVETSISRPPRWRGAGSICCDRFDPQRRR